MTNPSDELSRLWSLGAGSRTSSVPEMVRDVEQAAVRFDRMILFRDLREIAGGLLVAVIFIWTAIHDHTLLERAAHCLLAVCGAWIALYIRRYSTAGRKPVPEQSLMRYQQELLDRYDRQVRLLKAAKYWYILPLWGGLLFSSAAVLARTGDVLRFAVAAICVTAVNAGLWWLNEGIGVSCLQKCRQRLAESAGIEGAAE